MKPKKRKDDTGLYMRQWNMELRETISRNMVAYEQKVKECKELRKENLELQNNRDKAIEICDFYNKKYQKDPLGNQKVLFVISNIMNVLKGDSDEI